ncbi:MAG: flagellar hook basal-body protein [Planctomycetota bacterium]|nr:flagellar hook basal-body protein [Planctomycetota bacterium]
MNYGLYISASGALNATYRQDLHSSNLANLNTVGFKPDFALTRQRDAASVEDSLGYLPSNAMLERLGAGVMSDRTRVDFSQGVIRPTGNELDLAIRGEGFFTLLAEHDEGNNRLRLTRDGRFTLDATGRLVSATSGMPVVDVKGQPIQLNNNGPVTVEHDGTIVQNEEAVGMISIVELPNRNALRKGADGLFVADQAQMANRRQASGHIEQHAIEEAALNEIGALMAIQSASRDAQANLGMIGYHDRLMNQAINRFGRVT